MDESPKKEPLSRSQWSLLCLILAVTAGSVIYKVIVHHRLEQTAMLFIGIPTVLAIALTLTPKARTAKGGILKGITIALMLSGPLLGEGFVCILMASPLFYLVGIVVGVAVDYRRRKRHATISCLLLVLVPMSMEGVTPRLSFNRSETVQVSKIVQAPAREVEGAVSQSPRLGARLPFYLRLGFPRPAEARGEGLQIGAERIIHFAGGEGRPGDLILRVSDSRVGYVRFDAVSDHSKVAHWLTWSSSEVRWAPLNARQTRVTWALQFQRRLDPAWYFGPWERYAAELAAGYLIETNAKPAGNVGNN